MQTYAAEGKSNGLIIDHISIVKALRKAMADHTANIGGEIDTTIDKEELIERVLEAISRVDAFLAEHDFSLSFLIVAKNFAKLVLLR